MNIGQLCTRNVVTIAPGDSSERAAHSMLECSGGALVVTVGASGQDTVAGIITYRDIVRARLAHVGALSAVSADAAMRRDPLMCDESESVTNARRAACPRRPARPGAQARRHARRGWSRTTSSAVQFLRISVR